MERIRDVTVAEAIASEAGTDATPELMLGDVVHPVVLMQRRPPLAQSGYFPGTVGVAAPPVALNTSHGGIFGSGGNGAIIRVNWIRIQNATGGPLTYSLRRVDTPFSGFTAVAAVPGYINAGGSATGFVFTLIKTDTVAAVGTLMAVFNVDNGHGIQMDGPWILNDGALVVSVNTVNKGINFVAGYEAWPAIRQQPAG